MPPLSHQNKYLTDFKKKVELFNCFFAKQCCIINNSSELPSNILKKIDKSISTVTFTTDDIAILIQEPYLYLGFAEKSLNAYCIIDCMSI